MTEHIEDGARFTEIGGQFHDEVVRGCGNHTMIAVVGSLETLWTGHLNWWAQETAARGEYPSMSKRRIALTIHSKITDAIEAGDGDRARKLSARHIADTQTYFSAGDPEQRIVALSPQALARRKH
jgi:DNA-binding FadR family transcriptional regulator